MEFEGRVVSEEDLRRVLDGAAAGVDEFLEEHFAEDAVGFVAEKRAEDYGDAVVGGLDVDCFGVAVVDCAEGAAWRGERG